jgi:hypothetical protein
LAMFDQGTPRAQGSGAIVAPGACQGPSPRLGATRCPHYLIGEECMRPVAGVLAWLPWVLLTACVASHPEASTAGPGRAAVGRILTQGDIQVAEARLQAFGYDPGPVDGLFTAQTEAALRAFQRRYGLTVSGLLDRETRRELVPRLDPVRRQ